ncbi:MAG: CD225/dispanin family protein [Akkermansiaceae bacterium]|nr:CD225/dispanin family protein [Akkermansiaceae bacterium]MCF7732478.1 CD225/dispanin family protein [Akkermansiaceae bacterium]
MQWYYSKNGTQLGPVEQGELISKMASGEVAPGDLVWREGMVDWQPSAQVNELVALMPVSQAQPMGTPMAGSPYAPPTAGGAMPYSGEVIPNYLWQSIVVTILCCWPFGIPAIIYAAKVEGLKSRGDIAGARAASASAKTWCWVSFGLGLGIILIYVVMIGAGVMSSSSRSNF